MAALRELSDDALMRTVNRSAKVSGRPSSPASLSWSDVPGEALANAPRSAGEFAKNVAYPFMHPIQTAETFYDLGKGLLSKAGVIDADESTVNAIGQFFADRYGSVENLKKTLASDPVGVAADAATVLSGGAALGARAPGVVGQTARAVGTVGRAIDPVSIAGRAIGGAAKVAAYPLGLTTGAGSRAVQEAVRAGQSGNKTFVRHLRGAGDINEPVAMAKRAVSKLADRRRTAYQRGMGGIDPTRRLNPRPIGTALQKAEGKIYLQGVAKSDDAVKALDAIRAKINEYASFPPTVEVLDHMKQAIGEIRQKTEYGTLERSIADDIYNATKDAIVKQAPEYADVMKGYAEASENLSELGKTFSLTEKATKDTALRKIQSTMRNNVNTNYGARTKLGDQMSRLEPELTPAIAGQALSSWTPRGIQGALAAGGGGTAAYMGTLLDPTVVGALSATSPRLVGEAARLAGAAARPVVAGAARPTQQTGRVVRELPGAMGATPEAVTPDALSDDELMQRLNGRGGERLAPGHNDAPSSDTGVDALVNLYSIGTISSSQLQRDLQKLGLNARLGGPRALGIEVYDMTTGNKVYTQF